MNEMITIKVVVNRDIGLVWAAWTLPEHIIKWNFATDDWVCPAAANDLESGGKFSYRMESRDGRLGFDFSGTYGNILPNSKIESLLDDDRKVIVTFSPVANGVEINETFEADGSVSIEMQKAGWQSILNNFKQYVESI